jgi:hypothetical protein
MTVLTRGFNAARARFEALAGQDDADEAFIALFDAVAWSGAICDRLRDEQKSVPAEVNGLWFIRNFVLHQGADALARTVIFGAAYVGTPLGWPGAASDEWTWRDRSELPRGKSERGRAEYDSHLAGRQVTSVLDAVAAAF